MSRRTPRVAEMGCPDGVVRTAGRARLRDFCDVSGSVDELECVHSVHVALDVIVADDTGRLRCRFLGRTSIPGVRVGSRLRVSGRLVSFQGRRCLLNPSYELLGSACAESS